MYKTSTPTCHDSQTATSLHDSIIDAKPGLSNPGLLDSSWETFDWSKLNTPQARVRHTRRKSIYQIENQCNHRLAALEKFKHKTEALELCIEGIEIIKHQRWSTLLVYFDRESKCADRERRWSHVEWRKWDVIELLVRMAVAYSTECEKAHRVGATLFTDGVDRMFLALVRDILQLGDDTQEAVIEIREWEREGTMAVMEFPGLCTEELNVEDGEAR